MSVFVAALPAFYLDGLRERRATRRWVREYLGSWRRLREFASLFEHTRAYSTHLQGIREELVRFGF